MEWTCFIFGWFFVAVIWWISQKTSQKGRAFIEHHPHCKKNTRVELPETMTQCPSAMELIRVAHNLAECARHRQEGKVDQKQMLRVIRKSAGRLIALSAALPEGKESADRPQRRAA